MSVNTKYRVVKIISIRVSQEGRMSKINIMKEITITSRI